jgi:hypothetical protein
VGVTQVQGCAAGETSQKEAGEGRQCSAEHICLQAYTADLHSGQIRGALVLSCREKVAVEDRTAKQNGKISSNVRRITAQARLRQPSPRKGR